ncbi:hypothetical protein EMCRGX_G008289 [Ephydatia muelleri]
MGGVMGLHPQTEGASPDTPKPGVGKGKRCSGDPAPPEHLMRASVGLPPLHVTHVRESSPHCLTKTSSDALVVQDHQNIAYLGQTVGNVRQTSSDALVVQDHQNIAYLGQTVGNVRQTSSDALVVQDHQNIAYLDALVVQDHQNIAYLGQTVGNVRQTSSDALVVQDHQNIAYLGQTVGNVRQTSSDALVVQDHQNIAYLGQTVGNVRQTSSDALVVQDHQNIAYLGQTVGNVRQTSSDALVVQDHQNIAYLGQTVGNVRQTSSDALVVQDHQNIAYLGQTVGNVRQTSSDALVVQDHQNIAYLGQTVGNVVNLLVSGKASQAVSTFMASGRLVALNNEVLPQLSDQMWRRYPVFFFQPLQFEVAFRARAEKIIHSFRNCREQHWLEDDFVTFKVDMANAFNLVSRQAGHNLHLDTALKWRLGIDLFGGSRCPSCSTHKSFGHHALTCGYNG